MRIANLSIGVRLGAGYSILLVLLGAVALLGTAGMRSSNAALHHIVAENVHKMDLLDDMETSVHIVARVERTIALLDDEATARVEHVKIDQAQARYEAAFAALQDMPLDAAGRDFLARIRQHQAAATPLNERFMALAKMDKAAAVALLLKECGPETARWQAALAEFVSLEEEKNQRDEAEAATAYHDAMLWMLVLTAGAILFGSLMAWYSTHSITGPIRAAVKVAQTVATGDLSSRIDVVSGDETGQLLQALKNMNDSLVDIVGRVRGGTDAIAAASSQIAHGNLDLSARTERQASALEETASSMEELTRAVRQNAGNAQQANALAIQACDVAARGGAMVARVVTTMETINASSSKITDIIGVIDAIAFQTNILALNAAVEAARAGEQGRGFAVVAAEVRSLAQRSAAAAKEIKVLIDDSVAQVSVGTDLAGQAGATVREVVVSIEDVAAIMGRIAVASQEQTAGIGQINQSVTQIDEVTQQNAALVEEIAAAAGALQDQADALVGVVSAFDLGQPVMEDTAPVARAARRPPALRLIAAPPHAVGGGC
ncbi:methyl-accepting chemotaxis protein [Rugamonas aquatica]|uniref:HAMP domain-containing protein n=1 Tax=Rugamonas aquatica TaxID=2743357 RepID=A0A6A7N6M6_9BURK|nr:methyl-accepting chemotaxis protein [Rugamonas aquatica]MQA40686.1 HAMP domain-containing protein [Rugamonas aquatica]